MLLINNLHGPFTGETSIGRGSNAAYNYIKYIKAGKAVLEQKINQFKNGEISLEETSENAPFEALASAYIPYMPFDQETLIPDYEYGLAFAALYINAFDSDGDGAITSAEAGSLGSIINFDSENENITPGKFLAWLMFQDCTDVYGGVISPKEASRAFKLAQYDPEYVQEQLKYLYYAHKLDRREKSFISPHTS